MQKRLREASQRPRSHRHGPGEDRSWACQAPEPGLSKQDVPGPPPWAAFVLERPGGCPQAPPPPPLLLPPLAANQGSHAIPFPASLPAALFAPDGTSWPCAFLWSPLPAEGLDGAGIGPEVLGGTSLPAGALSYLGTASLAPPRRHRPGRPAIPCLRQGRTAGYRAEPTSPQTGNTKGIGRRCQDRPHHSLTPLPPAPGLRAGRKGDPPSPWARTAQRRAAGPGRGGGLEHQGLEHSLLLCGRPHTAQ